MLASLPSDHYPCSPSVHRPTEAKSLHEKKLLLGSPPAFTPSQSATVAPTSDKPSLTTAPEDGECVVAMQFGTTSQTDRAIAQHILDTAEVNSAAVP